MKVEKLSKINNYLSVVVILLGAYILISPFIPAIQDWWAREHKPQTALVQAVQSQTKPEPQNNITGNRLVIPAMNLDTEILEGASVKTVNNGAWRKPESSTPGQGGNTVIVGHRYSYNPGIAHPFYSLDIVIAGDNIGVYWDGVLKNYQVKEVLVVDPSFVQIEQPTQDETLTLYTCTPLWTSNQRLVIVAKPIGEQT